MVGVPRSKGCDSCKKQKKKVVEIVARSTDADHRQCLGSAPCPRCARLGIECTGIGVQRFTFKDETARLTGKASARQSAQQLDLDHSTPRSDETAGTIALAQILTPSLNHYDRIAGHLAASIDISLGSNIGLLWNFGTFLEDLPSRIGHNVALDAAIEALMVTYSAYKARRMFGYASCEAQTKAHNRALRALRFTLNRPDLASSTETLCSTMLLLMIESLSGPDGTSTQKVMAHAGGAATIIKARGNKPPIGDFESKVLLSLRGPIILQAMYSRRQGFSAAEWEALIVNPLEGNNVDARIMQTMAKLPEYLHSVRAAYEVYPCRVAALIRAKTELNSVLEAHIRDRREIVKRLDEFEKKSRMEPCRMPAQLAVLHSHFSRQACMAYAIEIHVLMLLSGAARQSHFAPGQCDLVDEHLIAADDCATKTLELAAKVEPHRPLGTICMGFVMSIAFAAARTRKLEVQITEKIKLYLDDIDAVYEESQLQNLRDMRNYLTCRDMRAWGLDTGFVSEASERKDLSLVQSNGSSCTARADHMAEAELRTLMGLD